ncbi:hypothetical protein CH63R_07360 [Colletotrichum higginsianum IMI 349063]|uniref:BTB domain-containing protein n=2 Tax=Colletotrichum higginsianum (strain IMI 349063) TaxID=759273 RepID=A0A1B7Y9H7_COLHI|nr:hypothetical protein CH63R_07360 [Colletotrichum higginsianum IMI 349063]OBR08595.1 hypothetical protein CH63R_07360 [Colletotrichum higginsianum IMI 349063]
MMGRQRSRSDDVASTSPKVRRFSNALRKISTMTSVKDDKPLKPGDDVGFGFGESSDAVSSRDSSSAIAFNDSDFNLRQLQQLTQRVRSTLASKDADAAFKNYAKARDHATLCQSLFDISILAPAVNGQANRASPEGRGVSHEVSLDVPHSPTTIDSRSSLSGRSLSEVTTGQSCGQRSGPSHKTCLSAVRDWKKCIESLLEALKLTLSETYKSYEPYATPRMVESLFHNKEFRAAAIQQMRKTSIDKTFSASPDFFPRYIIRLRNYDRVRQDLVDITRILQLAESGVSDERLVKEYHVSPRGDAILEFANIGAEPLPVLRFRVSSFLLAETSPIFERMFAKHTHIEIHDDEDVTDQLAPPPSPYICDDGTEAKLYRMPQQESDSEHALTILLHAAHMHNDKVPREVSFEQLVAIADVCLRYRCTSPLELFVEHRWLPQWIHKSSEDMPDGMLLISYAFGLRQLFTRMSKTIILNLVDEEELKNKPWPQKMKDRILAVRGAKMAQVQACCVNTIQEYLCPSLAAAEQDGAPNLPSGPSPPPQARSRSRSPNPSPTGVSPPIQPSIFSSRPRCPRGSHWCDATNLGWLMLIYGELQLLPTIMKPMAIKDRTNPQQTPRRSLAQLVDLLRTIASPPQALHRGGVCDPTPQFRTAISDIYNSVSGLTLYDISKRSHGWGLSRHRSGQPQAILQKGLKNPGKKEQGAKVDLTDTIRLRILQSADNVDDLHTTAMINRGFYQTFHKNQLSLMWKFVKPIRRMTLMRRTPTGAFGFDEDKVPKEEADALKADVKAAREADGGLDGPGEDERPEGSETQAAQGIAATGALLSACLPEGAPASDAPSLLVFSDEEAQQILWPVKPLSPPHDAPCQSSAAEIAAKAVTKREKSWVSDPAFVEEKMLLKGEDKHLREERDRRVGLVRDGEH